MKKAIGVVLVSLGGLSAYAQQAPPLTLLRTITLPGVSGKFDHFAIDLDGGRLFAAATGDHSVQVIDLRTDKIQQSISGLGKPHGLVWVAKTGKLYVADGQRGDLQVYQGKPLKLSGTIKLSDDADDMVYDDAHHALYVGHGGSDAATPAKIAVIDTAKFALVADIGVASHPEALDLDAQGQRVFANVAKSGEVAVIDAENNTVAAHWKLTGAIDNVPLAYDGEGRLLYVACRTPGTLLALNGVSGAEAARLPAAEEADDLFYDSVLQRAYVISGAGEVDTYQVDAKGNLHALAVTRTAQGAKTALFVPLQNKLYVGVPGLNSHPSEVRVFTTPTRESK